MLCHILNSLFDGFYSHGMWARSCQVAVIGSVILLLCTMQDAIEHKWSIDKMTKAKHKKYFLNGWNGICSKYMFCCSGTRNYFLSDRIACISLLPENWVPVIRISLKAWVAWASFFFFHQVGNVNNFRIKRKEEITCLSSKHVFSDTLVSSSVLRRGEVQNLLL